MAAIKWSDSRLSRVLDRIERHYGSPTPPPVAGPFDMILWEVVAYLADDARRGMAFDALRKQVGLTPGKILAAPKKLLMQFPMIGEPGAEKILMFSGVLGVLALEPNGLRALVRLGFGEDRKSYSATYKSVREVTLEELPADCKLLTKAHLLLRQHGQRLCLRNGPECHACPVNSDCRFFQGRG